MVLLIGQFLIIYLVATYGIPWILRVAGLGDYVSGIIEVLAFWFAAMFSVEKYIKRTQKSLSHWYQAKLAFLFVLISSLLKVSVLLVYSHEFSETEFREFFMFYGLSSVFYFWGAWLFINQANKQFLNKTTNQSLKRTQ